MRKRIFSYGSVALIFLRSLSLALQENCPLLTGDRNLRKAADQEGVQVHGTIWLVSEMLREKIIQPTVARLCTGQKNKLMERTR